MKGPTLLILVLATGSLFGPESAGAQTQLTLVKEVVGGDAVATEWALTADGTDGNDLSGAGWVSGLVTPDTFQLSESAGPGGYEAGDWDCIGGGTLDGQSLTLSEGENVTCTIVNTFMPPVVVFDADFALPSMPIGDGAGTPVCVDDTSGLLVAGCDVTITADEIDPTSVQRRVAGACAEGFSIRAVNADGSVVCEPDTDTTLSEGEVDAFVANNGYSTVLMVTDTSASTTYLTTQCSNYDDSAVSITVPGAGTILVEAQVELRGDHTQGTDNSLLVAIGASPTDCSSAPHRAMWEIPSEWPSASSIDKTLSLKRWFDVPSAGTYTYYVNGYMQSGHVVNTDRFWWSNMVATFYD